MIQSVILTVTSVLGIFLYVQARKRADLQAGFHQSLPTTEQVRSFLNRGFTGFVFCLNPVAHVQNKKQTSDIQKWMEQKGLPFFAFDGVNVLQQDGQIGIDLQIELFPCFIAVKDGKALTIPILIHPERSRILDDVEPYVAQTRRFLFEI